jgi:bifunctional non-homologous end joining protein LigD
VAKRIAIELAKDHPQLLTSEYRIEKRPPGRILVDYNQNAWGRTLASVYSVRPKPDATVSAPVTWMEVESGVSLTGFTMDTVPQRLSEIGDLFRPLLLAKSRYPLEALP